MNGLEHVEIMIWKQFMHCLNNINKVEMEDKHHL